MTKTTVTIDTKKIVNHYEQKSKRAQMALDAMVMNDSNYFCPLDSSELQKSVIGNSKLGSGLLSWNTDYARRQYYGVNFDHSKQKNLNARAKWFEAAKAMWLEKWVKLVDGFIKH